MQESETAVPEVSARKVLSAGLASTVAWSFDLFDLFIILYVASTIGPLFFPTHSATLTLAATFASFAVTLVMRPVGAAVFGPYADRHGRRRAMIMAVAGVGIATALLGALPTFATVGILAPILFLTLRLIQGIFVGGVVASTHTLATETVPQRWRGLMSGTVAGGAGIGSLLASLGYLLVSTAFPGSGFTTIGWRVMFGLGIIGSAMSLLILRSVDESPVWVTQDQVRRSRAEAGQARLEKVGIRELFSTHRSTFLLNVLIVTGAGTQYYLTSGYLPVFLDVVNRIPKHTAAVILAISSLAVVTGPMIFGHISEIIGRKRTSIIVCAANILLMPLAYWQISELGADDLGPILGYTILLSFLGNIGLGHIIIFLNERFPTSDRASGTALCWNMGFAIGGMMPTFVTLSAPTVSDIPIRLIIFILAATVIYLAITIVVPETKGAIERMLGLETLNLPRAKPERGRPSGH